MFPIAEVSDVMLAFPASLGGMLPAYADIPEKYKSHPGEATNQLFNDLFFCGLSKLEMTPREGVDPKKAWRHIRAISGSYEPKHEHKEAAVAFLLDEWFTDHVWKRSEK